MKNNNYIFVWRPLTLGLGLPPALAEIFGAYGCGGSGSRYFCGLLNDLLDGRDANNVDIVSKIKVRADIDNEQNSDRGIFVEGVWDRSIFKQKWSDFD